MTNRRTFLGAAAVGLLAPVLVPSLGGSVLAAPAPPRPPVSPGTPGGRPLTPAQALRLLKDGNATFIAGTHVHKDDTTDRKRRLQLAEAQAPIAAYLSCSDSRVPPELLFGRGLGELFIIRNAGNTVEPVAMGSIEFAVAILGVPLVVIMGHEGCGAVKAAISVVEKNATFAGSINKVVEPIIPAVLQARGRKGDLVANSARENVRRVVSQLRGASEPMLIEPQEQGKLMVVGAYYHLQTGKVDFFDEPPAVRG